jgi:hypothetical protein
MYREFCSCLSRYYSFIYADGIIPALVANPLLTEVESGAATSVMTRVNSLGLFTLDNTGTDSQQQRMFVFSVAVFRSQFLINYSDFTSQIYTNFILPYKNLLSLFIVLHDKKEKKGCN